MSEFIEKLAHAACEVGHQVCVCKREGRPVAQSGGTVCKRSLTTVRAVLAAAREPSEEMEKAGFDCHDHEASCATDYGYAPAEGSMSNAWRAMIDEALKP